MSDETKQALDRAIEAHFADIGDGRFVTNYALVVKAVDLNDDERKSWYKRENGPDQSFDITLGLFHTAILGLEEYWRSTDE